MFKKSFNSFRFAVNGLRTVWKEERNFRLEIFIGTVVIFCLFYFNFSLIQSALVFVAVTIVLCAEIVNTIVEDLCDKVVASSATRREGGNYDPIIGKIKDMSAAFVLTSVLGAVIVGLLVFYNHFF